jgi:hypothetical protein
MRGAEQSRRWDLGGAVLRGQVAQKASHDTQSPGVVARVGQDVDVAQSTLAVNGIGPRCPAASR